MKKSIVGILIFWFLLSSGSTLFGVFRIFGSNSILTPLLVVLFVGLPVGIFSFAYLNSVRFREFILSLNLCMVILGQTLRVIGGVFLILYVLNKLPGLFALPAGIGDIAIGVTAPFVAFVLLVKRPFPKRTVMFWNIFGILDLLTAVSLGIATSPVGIFAGEITILPVLEFPLALIPTFGVPFTMILHLIALAHIRRK